MSKISRKIKVGVIFGGRSGEHEVSIVSAQSVMKELAKKGYDIMPIGITKEGKWVAGAEAVRFLKDGIKRLPFKSVLLPDPTQKGLVKIGERGIVNVKSNQPGRLDVIFPLIHGSYGEDGKLQGLLEMADLPYVGAGVLGSALGMDKVVQKQLTDRAGIRSVEYDWVMNKDWQKNREQTLKRLMKKLRYPIFTKPANSGSSVGINKCHNQRELINGINEALKYDHKVIIEQGIEDIREIEVAVLGNDDPKASVPGEIVASNEFYDYDAKYIDGKSQAIIPAKLPKSVVAKIQRLAVSAFRALNLSGMARVDFMVRKKDGRVYLNEVNTIPGFTSISMYPKLWEASGLNYTDLLDQLIKLAMAKHQEKNELLTSYQPKDDWYK
ncbi:MAG: D-alanine--D-alanine ligase family protein [Patescibacteria group bacterium]|jgi:D-alanine-D-alanine ligase|nr:D-alanine--D-alanine ligase family protein [Patescibacteria group bacterium]